MDAGPVLPSRRPEQVRFEISSDAAAVIRRRGGALWIWAGPDRWPYATTEPPGDQRDWTEHRQAGFVVRVDRAIVPPQQWTVRLPESESRHLDARWNGLDPSGAFGRLPLVDPPEEDTDGGRDRIVNGALAGYAALVAVLWIFGIAAWQLELARWGALVVLVLLGLAVRGLRMVRRRREKRRAGIAPGPS